MTDIADVGATTESAPPAEVVGSTDSAPAAAPETTTPAAPTTTDVDPFDTSDLSTDGVVPRGRYDKAAKEGQAYREQARALEEKLSTYEQVYGQYAPEDRDTWFAMANEWARDPRAGAEMMQRISEAVLNDGLTPQEATEQVIAEDQVTAAADEAGLTLTPERVAQIVEEKLAAERAEAQAETARREQEAAVQAVFAEIREAGFDPESRDGHSILWTASNETNGDIAKAVEIVKAERQKIIDEYVSGKASTPSTRPAPDSGVLANTVPVLDTLDDAFKAANAFLDGMNRSPG